MRTMPTYTRGVAGTRGANDFVRVPTAAVEYWQRALDRFCGDLSAAELELVAEAAEHNWTIRAIVDAILSDRGQPQSPLDFDWRTI